MGAKFVSKILSLTYDILEAFVQIPVFSLFGANLNINVDVSKEVTWKCIKNSKFSNFQSGQLVHALELQNSRIGSFEVNKQNFDLKMQNTQLKLRKTVSNFP